MRRRTFLTSLAALSAAAVTGACSADKAGPRSSVSPSGAVPATPAEVLVTPDQRAMEAQAAQLLDTPALRAQIERSRATLAASRAGNNPDDRRELDGYLGELAFGAALMSVNADAARPRVQWNLKPGARQGLENADNIYRLIPVSPDSRYEITGQRGTSDDISFQTIDAGPWLYGRLQKTMGVLATPDLHPAADGTFTITLGPEPAAGRPHHIQLPPDARQIMIRDTTTDWSQIPMTLAVRRIDGPSAPPEASQQQLADRTAAMLASSTAAWIQVPEQYNHTVPANTLPAARPTSSGGLQGQYVTTGTFDITDDQALVITARAGTAKYLGFQLGSDWYISYNYWDHTSSLTNTQARPNADGSYTYVIAIRDPGVANWLDPVGHHQGLTLLRWQGVSAPLAPEESPQVKLVALADLPSALPPGVPAATLQDRAAQIDRRRQQINARANPAS